MDTVIPIADLATHLLGGRGRARARGRRRAPQRGPQELVRAHARARRLALHHQAVDDGRGRRPRRDVAELHRRDRRPRASSLALAISGHEAVQFTPMLLLGEPGLGKTLLREAARARARDRLRVRLDELAHRRLGADRRVGAVAQRAPGQGRADADRGRVRESGVVLDEVDKAGGDHRYDPMGALYSLLERDTATPLQGRVHRRRHGRVAHPVDRDGERRRARSPTRSSTG